MFAVALPRLGGSQSQPNYNAEVIEPTIRTATAADVEILWGLEREVLTAAHWSRAQYDRLFAADAPPRLCLVAETSQVLGFLVAQTAGPEWELENMVVAPSARRRGLGTRLLSELLARARQQGASAILLEVRRSNGSARALYQSCGFLETGVRLHYYQDPGEDAIICRYNLMNFV